MRRGSFVKYNAGGGWVKAIIRTCHRDGSYTIEALHFLTGEFNGGYLGYRYRMTRQMFVAA